MRVAVSGASGLIGSALLPTLSAKGYDVSTLVRHAEIDGSEIYWDAAKDVLDTKKIEKLDVLIHLAGKSIASARWTKENMLQIRESRIKGTGFLAHKLTKLEHVPKTFIVASAIGIYGDRGSELLTERSTAGDGFLAQLCHDWELAAKEVQKLGTRVVNLRFGIVLDKKQGALSKMLPPFLMGMGGPIGSGNQFMSWITLDDAINAINHIISNEAIEGPVNLVAPNPVTNKEFSNVLGKTLKRPAFMPVPTFAIRALLGEMADELLLASQRVQPTVLEISGFDFKFPRLDQALEHILV